MDTPVPTKLEKLAWYKGVVKKEEQRKEEESTFSKDLNIRLICPECRVDPPHLYENHAAGDIVCEDCGLVLGQRQIDTRSEWRTFSNDNDDHADPSRVGAVAGIEGEQLHTRIGSISNGTSVDLARAQLEATSSRQQRKGSQLRAEITDLCGSARLTYMVSQFAEDIFFKSYATVNISPVINHQAACIFIACRKMNLSRSFRELAELWKIKPKDLGHAFKKMEHFMKLTTKAGTTVSGGTIIEQVQYTTVGPIPAHQLVARHSSALGLEPLVIMKVEQCARALGGDGPLGTYTPLTVAGVAIYIVSHLQGVPRQTKEIAGAINCGASTIRHAYVAIYPKREQWLKSTWVMEGGGVDLLPALGTPLLRPKAVGQIAEESG